MRLITVGCAGSFAGPASPASTYLLQVAPEVSPDGRAWNVAIDLGSGGLGGLQRHLDPLDLDAVAISHLHPDHFLDLCGLYVYRRYHPSAGGESPARRLRVWGPAATAARVGAAYGLEPGETVTDQFDVHGWEPGCAVEIGPLRLEPFPVFHPVEAYGVRVTGPSSLRPGETATLAYTGDTDRCDALVDLARDADLLLSEAAFHEGRDDAVPPGIHLTGLRAGAVAADAGARRLVLTHLPAWNDPALSRREAAAVYSGPIDVATTDAVFTL